ncbi:divalent-cation tolerance protein CutA [Oceanicella actignis]|uniref:divalent-cation tolerance protein CutA n=1 Tax=Oceanicella actignis TaxID=1189325 RepID=UPI0011E6558A|nr:divalent-cation tolerance protein CutA [Oceanicella actignis]TYO90733.1 divalent cation tolerance protein [Oceanicella actignis]
MIVLVETTASSRDEAERIARLCVERGLAACANIDEVRSIYRWQGEMQEETEFRILLKTARESLDALSALIRANHSYEEPAILALEVRGGSPSFLAWVKENSRGEGG